MVYELQHKKTFLIIRNRVLPDPPVSGCQQLEKQPGLEDAKRQGCHAPVHCPQGILASVDAGPQLSSRTLGCGSGLGLSFLTCGMVQWLGLQAASWQLRARVQCPVWELRSHKPNSAKRKKKKKNGEGNGTHLGWKCKGCGLFSEEHLEPGLNRALCYPSPHRSLGAALPKPEPLKVSFLRCDSLNTKSLVLKWTIQGHLARPQCCAATTSVWFQNITSPWNKPHPH